MKTSIHIICIIMHQVYIPICKTVFFTERAPKVLPIPQLFSVVIVDLIPATCNIFMHACMCEIRRLIKLHKILYMRHAL